MIGWATQASAVKNLLVNAGDTGSMPGLGGSPGEGNDNPLQYSCLGNPMDRGAWWATVYGVAQSPTRHSDWTTTLLIWHLIHLFLSFLQIQRWQKSNDISYAAVQAKENPSFGGTSLAVQWLRLCVSNAGGMCLIPHWGIKILHAEELGQTKKQENPSSGVFIFNQHTTFSSGEINSFLKVTLNLCLKGQEDFVKTLLYVLRE